MSEPVKSYLNLYCGFGGGGGVPRMFLAGAKFIQFNGGKGVRYLHASGNYQTANTLNYFFQGLSDDGRYMIYAVATLEHPYLVGWETMDSPSNPFLLWTGGDESKLYEAYESFNKRIEELLDAGLVPTYPSLDALDALFGSIVVK
jgi:hypothetical protein